MSKKYRSIYILQLHHTGGMWGKTKIPHHLPTKHKCNYLNSQLNNVKDRVLVVRKTVEGIVVVVSLNYGSDNISYVSLLISQYFNII
ncbi:hypothetical protein PT2222_140351 [Paraburkholderia tropica]